jgi:predicted Fe-Mo cluster-binding NifX family protein
MFRGAGMKLAVATTDGVNINEHFGRAPTMTVIEADPEGAELSRETRPGMGGRVSRDAGHDSEETARLIKSFGDCNYVLAEKIGPRMARQFAALGVSAMELQCAIDFAIEKIARYERRRNTPRPF